ncbi:C-type lectin domain family 2 member B isoform 2-T2 [Molossus nigricans]
MADIITVATPTEEAPRINNSNQRNDTTKQVTQRPSTWYFCPDGWIGLKNNCYYFSKKEIDWNSSRNNCLTRQADLTVIDTTEEMEFLRQHKCTSDLWIGLEMTENQKGKWVNGNVFNNSFDVRGNEKCAYLSDDGVATARCYTERKWVCRSKKNTSWKK